MPSHTEVLIVIDALRADVAEWALSAGIAPNLKTVASQGDLRSNFWTAGSPTQFSMSSMMAGVRPLDGYGYEDGVVQRQRLLAQEMQLAGYDTVGASGSADLSQYRGYHRGFRSYSSFVCFFRRASVFGHELARFRSLVQSGQLNERTAATVLDWKMQRLIATERSLQDSGSFNLTGCSARSCQSSRVASKALVAVQELLRKGELAQALRAFSQLKTDEQAHRVTNMFSARIARDFLSSALSRPSSWTMNSLAAVAMSIAKRPNFDKASSDELVQKRIVEALRGSATGPLFVYAHFLGVHDATLRRQQFVQEWQKRGFGASLRSARIPQAFWGALGYIVSIMSVDDLLGDILSALRCRAGQSHRVVVTADHGFMLPGYRARTDTKGFAVATRFFDEIYRVPLIVEDSRQPSAPDLVSSDQLKSYILCETPAKSLIRTSDCLVFENLGRGSGLMSAKALQLAVRSGDKKIVVQYPAGWFQGSNSRNLVELYDLCRDPRETKNIATRRASQTTAVNNLIQIADQRMHEIRTHSIDYLSTI